MENGWTSESERLTYGYTNPEIHENFPRKTAEMTMAQNESPPASNG